METIPALQSLFRAAHEFLEGTIEGVSAEAAAAPPPGAPASIAAQYAHVVCSEDMGVHTLLGAGTPLFQGDWSGRTGLSETPPLYPGADLKGWARSAQIDLDKLRAYARAVYAATDGYLSTMASADLSGRQLDLSAMGFGVQPPMFVVTALLSNVNMHTGEISCLKGLQGAKGYPV